MGLWELLAPCVIVAVIAVSDGHHLGYGTEHHFTYTSVTDTLGMHNVTTVIRFVVSDTNETHNGQRLHQLEMKSFTQHAANGYYADNPMKWDLTKHFLFEMEGDGTVNFVHYHKEDKYEMVTLKKVLVGTLAVKTQIGTSNNWRYSAEELDHGGELRHDYEGERTSQGVVLKRYHRSVDKVHRQHDKTVHFDTEGSVSAIAAVDNITTYHSEEEVVPDEGVPMTEDHSVKVFKTGEFPVISSTAQTRVHLTLKRKQVDKALSLQLQDMTRDSVEVKENKEKRLKLNESIANINRLMKCVLSYKEKHEANRTLCVVELKTVLGKLIIDDLKILGNQYLNMSCKADDTLCVDVKFLMIDVIAHLQSNTSQELLIKYVLATPPNVTDAEVERCLLHCIAVENPIKELISAVEVLCFGHNGEHHGKSIFASVQKRACLALGAIAKKLRENGEVSRADGIVHKLEQWLTPHDEEHFVRTVKPRNRRSVGRTYSSEDNHVSTKRVLIHTLGNAGHARSLTHITSYMEPGKANPSLRRAAAHALRHFKCNNSATALLTSALHDKQDIVRKMAFNIYKDHPENGRMTTEQENIILSKNYTYPVVSRLRRSVMSTIEKILKALSFRIELPPVRWKKVVGSSKIGASFGISMENYVELKLSPFEGHFELKVEDEAYAKANAGIINRHFDIVHARVCYKKEFHYDLNILKNFKFDEFQNLAKLFDNLYHKIVDPIEQVIDTFKSLVYIATHHTLQKLVQDMKDTIHRLPKIIVEIGKDIVKRYKEIASYDGYPLVNKIKQLINRVKSFASDIKDDVLGFYHAVVDVVTVTFPYVKKEVMEGFELVGKYWKIWENPIESFRGIDHALAKFRLAVTAFIEGKNRLLDACFFLKGRTPYWFHPVNEVKGIVNDLWQIMLMFKQEAKAEFNVIKHKIKDKLGFDVQDDAGDDVVTVDQSLQMEVTDGLNKNTRKSAIHEVIHVIVQDLLHKTIDVSTLAKPFMDAFHTFTDLFTKIKNTYQTLKTWIEKGKAFVQKIFGAKFHRNFPRNPAPSCDECGCGQYETKSENGSIGIDLVMEKKTMFKKGGTRKLLYIVNPMNGIVFRKSNSEVIIQPQRSDLLKYEIVIGRIDTIKSDIDEKWQGEYLRAGHVIGSPRRYENCPVPFIHVAMRKRKKKIVRDSEYEYIDPTHFLKKKSFLPKWKPQCKEAYFHYIGQVADDEEMPDEPDETHEEVKRATLFKHHRGKRETSETAVDVPKPAWKTRMTNWFKKAAGKIDLIGGMIKKTAGHFSKIIDALTVNTNNKNLNQIKDILIGSPLIAKLDSVINELEGRIKSEPLEYPDSLPLFRIRRDLIHAKLSTSGDRLTLIERLLTKPLEICGTSFADGVAPGYGHACTADKDCKGITCGVLFPEGFVRHILKTILRIDTCNQALYIAVDRNHTTIPLKDHAPVNKSFIIRYGDYKEFVFYLSATMDYEKVKVDLSGAICRKGYDSCNPDIQIFQSLNLKNVRTGEHCDSDIPFDPTLDMINDLNLPDLLEMVSEYHMNVHDVMILVNELRDAIVDALKGNNSAEAIDNGFPGSDDICMNFEKPFGPYDLTIFDISFRFMVGPVPLRLEFGAGGNFGINLDAGMCFMTMTATGGVTPKVGAHVWGSLSVDIFVAYGGIRLDGYLVQTSFPMKATLKFSKFPIQTVFTLDLELVPLELRLKAFAKARLLFVTVTVFDACIWRYKMATIKINLINTNHAKKDNSPPKIGHVSQNQRRKRDNNRGGCEVAQLEGREPDDTAFMLEINAEDEVSDVKVSYCIGTHSGGHDVMQFTEMKGRSLIVPSKLINGLPLHWTMKAENSNGASSVTQCMLDTYDNTIPDGRIEASYPYTSHPDTISATVFVFDDSPLVEEHFHGVGFTQGEFGTEVVPWQSLRLHSSTARQISNMHSSLRYFSIPRDGKLTALPIKRVKLRRDEQCADECLRFGKKCISFDFEEYSESCELLSVIQGPAAELRINGMFKNYERLGVGYNAFLKYKLDLKHGSNYFVNSEITNTLGYKAYITSEGTMVDYTPPSAGPIGNASQDITVSDMCKAAITQRCIDVTDIPNHRKIIDGPGANTVFNGHEPLVDQKYTLINHYMSGNWDGFHDKESGIFGYTWAVGTTPCGTDISDFSDPHAHLSSRKFWTNTGYARELHLEDGPYYVTVQGVNGVVHGGAMVTTVCHSNPITVDTTPPVFKGITDLIFEEDFDMMAVYYNTSDSRSHISRIDFGLGKTKHDVELRGYRSFDFVNRKDPFIVVKDLQMKSGLPAWIRIRSVNNVGLFTTGSSDSAILIDKTPPVAGLVLDGDTRDVDLKYQSKANKICANWKLFYDPESGISLYTWGVGTAPGKDDVVEFHQLSHRDKDSCKSPVNLRHNVTYYSTVKATNAALNPKSNTSHSDGVLVDTTPPTKGIVQDGPMEGVDIAYSSETAEIAATWTNFTDPESKIAKYRVDVIINDKSAQSFDVGTEEKFRDYSLSFKQGDTIKVRLIAENGAGLPTVTQSDGFTIDLTSPVVKYIYDNKGKTHFQSDDEHLNLAWKFIDDESKIKEYKYHILESYQGSKTKIYPKTDEFIRIPIKEENTAISKTIKHTLKSGATYSVSVTALNHADMPSTQESVGVMIDSTPPQIVKVHIGQMKIPEEEEDGKILHDDQKSMTISWEAVDYQSDILNTYVAIGTSPNDTSVTGGYIEFGHVSIAVLEHLDLRVSEDSASNDTFYYYVSVKVVNGAGMETISLPTKPINVLKANVPGKVYDGRRPLEDQDFTHDRTSIAMSFVGFESEACNIIGYEWAIGYEILTYDVLPFTDYGIVMMNDTYGHAQIHVELYEGSTYYITVRAKTGYNCKEEYILSSSNGIKLDTTPPDIAMVNFGERLVHAEKIKSSLYQSKTDSLEFRWNATDKSGIEESWWSIGSLPQQEDIHPRNKTTDTYLAPGVMSLHEGDTFFLNTGSIDKAGNERIVSSPPITVDTTIPIAHNFFCTPFISIRKSLVDCHWSMIEEYESSVKSISIGVGLTQTSTDISDFSSLSYFRRSWTRDFQTRINFKNTTKVYILLKITNGANLTRVYPRTVVVDSTVPNGGKVEIVTTLDLKKPFHKQLCQIPKTYVEFLVSGWQDGESGIERYEAAIGYNKTINNLKDFVPVETTKSVLITGLGMREGMVVKVTVRAYNKAGLYSYVTSDPIIISYRPVLTVLDGRQKEDLDYQNSLSVLEGRWHFSDLCPITHSLWWVEDIAGTQIGNTSTILHRSTHFYSDLMELTNEMTYINVVQATDALNRTYISRSDGVTVKIQPPLPGHVRDGKSDDINYQESIHKLAANWDEFGNVNSTDPTQKILYYEVAIGNDRRYVKTRTNVHYFVNVGLNRSYEFTGLNLTAKSVTYYITVRGYSAAGSFDEGYSNGIKVGYSEDITPGAVSVNAFQSNTDKITVSWSDFEADMGIASYAVGVKANASPHFPNTTLNCDEFMKEMDECDIVPVHVVGKNSFIQLENLSLLQAKHYYVLVVGKDATGACSASVSKAVTVDTTPPLKGTILIEGTENLNVIYINNEEELTVTWEPFEDPESNVVNYQVEVYSGLSCTNKDVLLQESFSLMTSVEVFNDNTITFYDLRFEKMSTYVVLITAWNGANLKVTVQSLPIRLDTTPPQPGAIRLGTQWEREITFQSQREEITGLMAVTDSEYTYECPRQTTLIPGVNVTSHVQILNNDFSPVCVSIEEKVITVDIRHDASLTKLIRGGIELVDDRLMEGNYSFNLRAAAGLETVTSIFIGSNLDAAFNEVTFTSEGNYSAVDFKQWIAETSDELFHSTIGVTFYPSDNVTVDINSTESPVSNHSNYNSTDDSHYNITTVPPYTSHRTYPATTMGITTEQMKNVTEDRSKSEEVMDDQDKYGFGVHIPGFKFENKWYMFIWVRDKTKTNIKQVALDVDPTDSTNEIIFSLYKAKTDISKTWNVEVFINGQAKSSSTGLDFKDKGIVSLYTWNRNNYFPPVSDPFHPFKGQVVLHDLRAPLNTDKPCKHGKPFYDKESKIREIWVGVSDTANDTATISPMKLLKTLCIPCPKGCDIACDVNCSTANHEFSFIDLSVKNLTLTQSEFGWNKLNISKDDESKFDVKNYFLNVEVVNMAGLRTTVTSPGVMVDATPPRFQYVRCVDPSNSMDEAVLYQGTKSSMGAYWECDEDIGDIVRYNISIGTTPGSDDIFASESVGREKKARVDDLGSKLFHDTTYFFTVEALNSAGLVSRETCNVTVEIYPPDVTNVAVGHLFTSTPSITDTGRDVGIQWTGAKQDVAFYEWQIGSTENSDDIFPRVRVGISTSKRIALVNGRLSVDNIALNTSVAQFATRNWTKEEIDEAQNNTFFNLEPGLCIHVTLFAVGRSHLSSSVDTEPMCVKRATDKIINLPSIVKKRTGGVHSALIADGANSAILRIQGLGAQILSGVLNQTDFDKDYGTAASSSYERYIVDPKLFINQTTRILRNRLEKPLGLSFYVTPKVPNLQSLRNIQTSIIITFAENFDRNTCDPELVFWDKDKQVMTSVSEVCTNTSTSRPRVDYNTHSFTVELCPDLFQLPAIHSTNSSTQPRMFTLMVANKTYPNTRPVVDDQLLTTFEDWNNATATLRYHDAEDDDVVFNIEKQPQNVKVNIMNDSIHFVPSPNFNGNDEVLISASEVGLDGQFIPLTSSTKRIPITIKPQNDAPTCSFTPGSDATVAVIDTSAYGLYDVHITFESNKTRQYNLGDVLGMDIDGDVLTHLKKFNNTQLANFTHHIANKNNDLSVSVGLSVDNSYYGDSIFSVRFKDNKLFSDMVNVIVHVLFTPCVHGQCQNETSIPCNDSSRSQSFSKFSCSCDLGYEGQWCQTETNECDTHACSVFFDCEDLIGRYQCNLNIPKTFGLALSIAVLIGIIVFLVRKRLRPRSNKIDDSYDWENEPATSSMPPRDDRRPLTAKDIGIGMRLHSSDTNLGESAGTSGSSEQTHESSVPIKRKFEVDDSILQALNLVTQHSKRVGDFVPPHYQSKSKKPPSVVTDDKWAYRSTEA